jgi:predicted metal-dependent enzyme (double-stranded beta helix superfamily)
MRFDRDQFIADCLTASKEVASQVAVRHVLNRAVSEPSAVLQALGEPKRAEMQKLFQSSLLTILNVIWAPWMTLLPHNHHMWALIGIYTGREDNIYWRRVPGKAGGLVEAMGAKALCEKETLSLGHEIIHSVTNPIPRLTGAIHVYGGDFFGVPRSEWDSETLLEHPCDGEKMQRRFDEANALFGKS